LNLGGKETALRDDSGSLDGFRVDSPRYVYFIRAVNGGPIKIGSANYPGQRLSQLQTGNPMELTIVGLIPLDDNPALEQRLHVKFGRMRLLGEWFAPSNSLLRYIQSNAASPSRLGVDW
jgi:hypothetical protein